MYDGLDRIRVRNGALTVTALAWILLIEMAGIETSHVRHHAMNGPTSIGAIANWVFMLASMMTPVLIPPIQFVRHVSLPQRRRRATLLFVAGYTVVWTAMGFPMLSLAQALRSSELPSYFLVALLFAVAVVWQCSPAKQAFLNRCHATTELSVFGGKADRDALIFGAIQGMWCAGSCWPWMLLPLLVPSGHLTVMVVASVLIFCERLDNPAPIGWRWRGLGRARRIIKARVQMRMIAA